MSTIQDRQIAQIGKFSKVRPAGVRDLKLSGSKLTWVEPQDTRFITHYNVRVGKDTGDPAYQVPVGQNSCVLSAGDKDFWVSAANKTMGTESPMLFAAGKADVTASLGSVKPAYVVYS